VYQVHEFAELAGVTVKALHHYDRIGLLKPRRSSNGYRLYEERDLERLEQIVALRYLGVPLKEVKTLLERDAIRLPAALRAQRVVLERKRLLLDGTIEAIGKAERLLEEGKPAAPEVFRQIIQAIHMQTETQDASDFMQNYYRAEGWARFRALHRDWPSHDWDDLFREIQGSLDEDPAGPRAQEFASRWRLLRVRDSAGDAGIHSGLLRAWHDRQFWPEEMHRRFADFQFDRISDFIRKSFAATRHREFGDIVWLEDFEGFPPEERERLGLVDLYFKLDDAVRTNPREAQSRSLVARWMELVESRTGGAQGNYGDMEGFLRWRQTWPAKIESRLTAIQFEAILAFIVKSLQC
jgi:DNA-binding transcriptional MerR regulator